MPDAATGAEGAVLAAAAAGAGGEPTAAEPAAPAAARAEKPAAEDHGATSIGPTATAQPSMPEGQEDDPAPLLPAHSHASFASPAQKPFLGGFRNRQSGAVFHHAATQTDPLPQRPPSRPRAPRLSSGAQTDKPQRSRAAQCACDAATQCLRPGWAEDRSEGRMLELPTGPYVSGEQVVARRNAAATTIQRHARGWLARHAVAPLRQARADLAAFLTEQAQQQAAAAEAARQYEIQRRMQPRTQADFVLLYDELAMWWGQEQAKIAAAEGITDEERQAMRRALLAKETKLLQTIDRLKLAAAPVVRAQRAAKELAAAAAPKHWALSGGGVVEVATPATLRAGELAVAYHALLVADGSNLDARLTALLAVKYHAKAVDCSLTREIVGLVDREADLLNRGRDPAMMSGLRTRLANQFLEFVRREQAAAAAGPGPGPGAASPLRRLSDRHVAAVQAG
ncbi:hypothetical protein ABPG75_003738 [Micractinium tetrahymenae]